MQRTDITYLRPQSQYTEKAGFKPGGLASGWVLLTLAALPLSGSGWEHPSGVGTATWNQIHFARSDQMPVRKAGCVPPILLLKDQATEAWAAHKRPLPRCSGRGAV